MENIQLCLFRMDASISSTEIAIYPPTSIGQNSTACLPLHPSLYALHSGQDLGWEGVAPIRLDLAEDDDDDYEYYNNKSYNELHPDLQSR